MFRGGCDIYNPSIGGAVYEMINSINTSSPTPINKMFEYNNIYASAVLYNETYDNVIIAGG